MKKELLKQALIKVISGFILLCLLIFMPAGTFSYFQGWLLICVLFIPMFIMGIYLLNNNPELLRKRLNSKEEESEQKAVIVFSGLMFLCSFVVCGLNYRFRWHVLPIFISVIASIIFLIGYSLYFECMKENDYLSRTVEVQDNQKVIDTGLYGIIRHPMYLSTLLMFLSIPLILGSLIGFIIMHAYIPIISLRISNEEKVLEEGLDGYKEYKLKVRYKIIPYIW